MSGIVIAGLARTAVGAFGGNLKDVSATALGVATGQATLARAGLDPAAVDELICGSGGQPIAEANVARQIGLRLGLPESTPAFSVQRNCASGLQALTSAAQSIAAGDAQAVLAVGAENMSQAPYLTYGARWGLHLRHQELRDAIWEGLTDAYSGLLMGETAENLAERYQLSRQAQDAFALESHRLAYQASRTGLFKAEIAPVQVAARRNDPAVEISRDEGPSPALSPDRMAMAPTIFKKGGTVTPLNSCPLNDAAASCLVMSEQAAKDRGITPQARLLGYAYAGCDPKMMGLGPVPATQKLLKKLGLRLDQIDLIEINEAFAAQVLACQRELDYDPARANVSGGAIALGHPIGATGLRLTATLVHAMARLNARLGLVTLCIGGGQGAAAIFERWEA